MALVSVSNPQPPVRQSLKDGLAAVLDEYRRGYGIRVELWTSGGDENLAPGQAEAIVHIVRETLAVIRRFSQSAVCRIRLRLSSRPFVLEVLDEGDGLAHPAADEYALLGVKARAAGIMSHVELVNTPGSGTTLFVFGPRRRHP